MNGSPFSSAREEDVIGVVRQAAKIERIAATADEVIAQKISAQNHHVCFRVAFLDQGFGTVEAAVNVDFGPKCKMPLAIRGSAVGPGGCR